MLAIIVGLALMIISKWINLIYIKYLFIILGINFIIFSSFTIDFVISFIIAMTMGILDGTKVWFNLYDDKNTKN